MKRKELLQYLIDKFNYEHYLEIGVHKGKNFLPIVCRKKIAVDPAFRISPVRLVRSIIQNNTNLRNSYFQMTSDKFFEKRLSRFKAKNYPDLVFIDGLHTFEASLKDVLHALYFLKPGGTIVLHDCFPPNSAAATPASSLAEAAKKNIDGWTGTWCGDVWKTIVYLKQSFPEDLEIFVLNSDMGLGVVRKTSDRKKFIINDESFQEILNYDYKFFKQNLEAKIDLTDPAELPTLLEFAPKKIS